MNTEEKRIRDSRTTGDYRHYSTKVQAYEISDMWIGSDKKQRFTTNTLPLTDREGQEIPCEQRKFSEKKLDIPEGVTRISLEIFSNAVDNVISSVQSGVDPGQIEITCDSNSMCVKNYGLHIPIKKMGIKKSKGKTVMVDYKEGMEEIYPPEFIFGQFRTSSNYDKTVLRMGNGRNGVGAKIANLFSIVFSVKAGDPDTNLVFEGTWKDNMFKDFPEDSPESKPKVIVKERKIKKGFVEIRWELDFERFSMKGYGKDEIDYFARIAADFSFACKSKFVFNGITLDYRSIYDYASLYFSEEEISTSIVQYTWGFKKSDKKNGKIKNEISTKKADKTVSNPKKLEDYPHIEIMILDTPDKPNIVSHVNGLVTKNGGTHVEAALTPIINHLRKIVNGDKKGSLTVSPKDIKPHLSAIINARIPDPGWDSQSKTELKSPEMFIDLEQNLLKRTNSWETISRLFAELEAKGYKGASATDGKKKPTVRMKGEDANFAGDKESLDCVLYITEGDSAAGYPQFRINMVKGGRDYNGYMPLRGKILNVTKAKQIQYVENKVIAAIKEAVGFREGVDYTLQHNLKELRYGYIVIVADADVDGMHIVALVLNLLREKFPGVLKTNRVSYLRTPVIKAFKGQKIVKRFFSEKEFYDWKDKNPKEFFQLRVRYYKGLGTSNEKDVRDDIEHAPTMICFYDDQAQDNLNLAFHEEKADDRKAWIEKWRDVTQVEDVLSVDLSKIKNQEGFFEGQNISQFINRELVGYSVSSLYRAIPSKKDHLKEAQRKGLYGVLKHFNFKRSNKDEPMKIESIANKAAAELHYHHGPKNLSDTIIKMAQDFTGSNNMGYFTKDGIFGTRADGGEQAAAARYSEVRLNWWIPYVFHKESIELVEKRNIDGKQGEPIWIPSVIPMGIVNGMNGIATAYSTFIPCHNPLDIVRWYKGRCMEEKTKPIEPWFNGFKGELVLEDRTKGGTPNRQLVQEMLPGDLNRDDPFDKNFSKETVDQENMAIVKSASRSKKNIKTIGKFVFIGFTKNNHQILKITELPIRSWTIRYKKWIDSLILEKGKDKLVSYVRDRSTPNKINIEIHWKSKEISPDINSLKLTRSFGLSNITLIDDYGFPKKYKDTEEVMETFFQNMIEHYTSLRDFRIKVEQDKIQYASYKTRYIQAVLDGEIKIVKEDEEKIKEVLEKINVPWKIYDEAKQRDLSKQSLERWKKEMKQAEARLEEAKKDTPQKIWLEKLEKLEIALEKRWDGTEFNMEE